MNVVVLFLDWLKLLILRDLILFLFFTGLKSVFPLGIQMRWLIIHVSRLIILMGNFFYSSHRLYKFQSAMVVFRILALNRLQEEGI
jgi:hypothetical protein